MPTNESIRVIARFRPSFELEQKSQKTRKIDIQVTGKLLSLRVQQHQQQNTFYSLDGIMDEKTTPEKVFAKIAQPICDGILQGYNGTIITYGQSGSGKSCCMYGPETELVGIIPRSCCYIFQILKNKHHPLIEGMLSYEVKCEFLEIQCNQLKDLLNLNNTPQIKERCVNRQKDEWKMFTTNTKKVSVQSDQELLKYLHHALKINGRSSRSHMVMNLFVKIQMANSERTSVLRFFDLEGSEKMKEPLSKVIEAVVEKKEAPFTDTELTYLLKNSLGGNCKTALIICCSPDLSHINETMKSLNFGVRCRTIQNYPKQNKELKEHFLIIKCKKQQTKIRELEKQIEILKDPNQVYVNIDNEKSVKAEKKRFMKSIDDLEKHIKRQSDQIKQLGKEKLLMDRAMEKHNNDCRYLEFKNKELITNVNEKNEEIQMLKIQIKELENINKELVTVSKGLEDRNEQLNVNNERLKENKEEQLIEINKLKTEGMQSENKWERELDNNKSKFSEHEMELTQIIESLKKQLQRKNEELVETHNILKEKQNNVYELKDEIRNINHNLKEEQNNSVELQTTNEELLCDLEKHVERIESLNNETNEQNNIFEKQTSEIKELLLKVEMKTNELENSNNTIKQMKKQHETEMNDLKYKLGNMTQSNKQLEEENKVIEIQSKQLQAYYYEIVQQQIDADHELASKLQTAETEELIKRKNKRRNKGGFIGSDDETNDNPVYVTPGMETEIINKFAPDDVKQDDVNDDNKYDIVDKFVPPDDIFFNIKQSKSVESDEDEIDIEAEQMQGFQNLIHRKKSKSSNVFEKNKEHTVVDEDFNLRFAQAIYNSQVDEHNEKENRKRKSSLKCNQDKQ